jgi:hypothetical protein
MPFDLDRIRPRAFVRGAPHPAIRKLQDSTAHIHPPLWVVSQFGREPV